MTCIACHGNPGPEPALVRRRALVLCLECFKAWLKGTLHVDA